MKTLSVILFISIFLLACQSREGTNTSAVNSSSDRNTRATADDGTAFKNYNSDTVTPPADAPKNVRDFFMLLPEKYFTLESCDRDKDKDCEKAREDYLKEFAEVDIANGYIKGGCDGGQACIEMAIFKRPDGSYLVGVSTFAEMINDYYFLDYNVGKWKDVSSDVVPQFSKKNMYEMPQNGTTVKVFEKKIVADGPDFEASEKGRKLYDLIWKDGRFSISK